MSLYRLISIEQSSKFNLSCTDNWYHYIIANDQNRISGYRSGDLEDVRKHTRDVITRLNKNALQHSDKNLKPSYKAYDMNPYY